MSWRAPEDDGGTPLLGYVVESQPGGQRLRVGPDAREVTFTDLPSTEALRFTVAALNVYDMLKAASKAIEVTGIRLLAKTGGKSGDYRAPEPLAEGG